MVISRQYFCDWLSGDFPKRFHHFVLQFNPFCYLERNSEETRIKTPQGNQRNYPISQFHFCPEPFIMNSIHHLAFLASQYFSTKSFKELLAITVLHSLFPHCGRIWQIFCRNNHGSLGRCPDLCLPPLIGPFRASYQDLFPLANSTRLASMLVTPERNNEKKRTRNCEHG